MGEQHDMKEMENGSASPALITEIPGPASRALSHRLSQAECQGITALSDTFPVFWKRALGANVWDVDGNRFVDLTAGFGVASYGHSHPALLAAANEQMGSLVHGMGDVHPPEIKVSLLEALSRVTPGDLGFAILGQNGSDAVEAALKAAYLHTGRKGVIAFSGAYHGLSGLALEVTRFEAFKTPFSPMLGDWVVEAPFPDSPSAKTGSLAEVKRLMEAHEIGAVIVEPIQGRGGVVVPPSGFLKALRDCCDGEQTVLICDEIMTGMGRTGLPFACQHEGVIPDLICVGKAVTGGWPLSACLGTAAVMSSWPRSTGEAIHTSTYLGHPVACAVGCRAIELMEELNLPLRADRAGQRLRHRLERGLSGMGAVSEIRGIGLMIGVELIDPETGAPSSESAVAVMKEALQRGVLILPGGMNGNVISLTPPLTMGEAQLDEAIDILIASIKECA
jgi:4-aminobutyrate aminotransferase/(S)-3-amino-2-methylpropionate transaminase